MFFIIKGTNNAKTFEESASVLGIFVSKVNKDCLYLQLFAWESICTKTFQEYMKISYVVGINITV